MKKMAIVLVSLLILMSVAGSAGAANQGSGRVIEKLTFVHYAGKAQPLWDDTAKDFKLLSGGVKWADTVDYEINAAGSGLTAAAVTTALGSALETWDAATSFELFSAPTTTAQSATGLDGTNRVVWQSLGSNIIGVNYVWYYPSTKQIIESDVIFSTDFSWSTGGSAGAMDLQNIGTHEFGHNGLGDLKSAKASELTMYGYSTTGETKKQTLGNGDMLGIKKLYGN